MLDRSTLSTRLRTGALVGVGVLAAFLTSLYLAQNAIIYMPRRYDKGYRQSLSTFDTYMTHWNRPPVIKLHYQVKE